LRHLAAQRLNKLVCGCKYNSSALMELPRPSLRKKELLVKLIDLERQVRELTELVEAATLEDDDSTIASIDKLRAGCGVGSQD
jgi:hypothetical protein